MKIMLVISPASDSEAAIIERHEPPSMNVTGMPMTSAMKAPMAAASVDVKMPV